MKKLICLVLLVGSATTFAQSQIQEQLNHLWVNGVYVNQSAIPNWGFLVDVQEENFFAAVFGYDQAGSPTFIDLVGTLESLNPFTYSGVVYFFTDNGSTRQEVGNFTWSVAERDATPSAFLTMTSNILDATNLRLDRFSYVESDKVDMLTGGDWNIVRRSSNVTFGDYYRITDSRIQIDGVTYAEVLDFAQENMVGAVAYNEDSVSYTMGMEQPDGTLYFYAFVASDTGMYGRYWFLNEGETPTGNGSYFRGYPATLQFRNLQSPQQSQSSLVSDPVSEKTSSMKAKFRDLEKYAFQQSEEQMAPMFSQPHIASQYEKLRMLLEYQRGLGSQ